MPSSDQPTTPMNAQSAAPSVSVIMPVYNSQDYVEEAIRSLLDQDFDNFEVIAIDDGSADDAGSICDKIAAQDERLRVVHQQNKGRCAARNAGIDMARGEYVMFCDNDDRVRTGFISDNYAFAKEYDADLVRFGRTMTRIDRKGAVLDRRELSPSEFAVYDGVEILSNIDVLLSLSDAVWAGMYRKSFLDEWKIRFDEELRSGGEDGLFNDMVYQHANRMVMNPRSYYEWLRRGDHSGSLTFDENTLNAFKKRFVLEDSMLKEADVPSRAPELYAAHMIHPFMDTLTAGVYARRGGYPQEREIYEMLYDLYTPYFESIKQAKPRKRALVAFNLLEKKRYHQLYLYANCGVRAKNAFKKALRKDA